MPKKSAWRTLASRSLQLLHDPRRENITGDPLRDMTVLGGGNRDYFDRST